MTRGPVVGSVKVGDKVMCVCILSPLSVRRPLEEVAESKRSTDDVLEMVRRVSPGTHTRHFGERDPYGEHAMQLVDI